MVVNSKKYLIFYVLLIVLLLVAGGLNLLDHYIHNSIAKGLIFVFISNYYIGLVVIWAISLQRRVVNRNFSRQYMIVAIGLLAVVIIKIIKYRFSETEIIERYLWYMMYVPMLIVPVGGFFATLYLGKEEYYKMNPLWRILWIPTLLFILLIMTNDFHQLAFVFLNRKPSKSNYEHGPLYYMIVLWIATLYILILGNTISKSDNLILKKHGIIPLGLLFIAGVGYIVQILLEAASIPQPFSFPDWFTFSSILYLESLIQVHLVRTNVGYQKFYDKTDLITAITNSTLDIVFESGNSNLFTLDNMANSLQDSYVVDGKYKIHSIPLKTGYFFYVDDLTEVVEINEKIKDIGVSLEEENEMMEAVSSLREKKLRIEHQNTIINHINELVKADVLYITACLEAMDPKDINYVTKVKKIFLPLAYLKRKINLFLISYNENNLPAKEIGYSINELIEYVRILGIEVSYSLDSSYMGGEESIQLFTLMYQVIEYYIDTATSIFIRAYAEQGQNYIRLLIDHEDEKPHIQNLQIVDEYEDGTSIITIKGGAF